MRTVTNPVNTFLIQKEMYSSTTETMILQKDKILLSKEKRKGKEEPKATGTTRSIIDKKNLRPNQTVNIEISSTSQSKQVASSSRPKEYDCIDNRKNLFSFVMKYLSNKDVGGNLDEEHLISLVRKTQQQASQRERYRKHMQTDNPYTSDAIHFGKFYRQEEENNVGNELLQEIASEIAQNQENIKKCEEGKIEKLITGSSAIILDSKSLEILKKAIGLHKKHSNYSHFQNGSSSANWWQEFHRKDMLGEQNQKDPAGELTPFRLCRTRGMTQKGIVNQEKHNLSYLMKAIDEIKKDSYLNVPEKVPMEKSKTSDNAIQLKKNDAKEQQHFKKNQLNILADTRKKDKKYSEAKNEKKAIDKSEKKVAPKNDEKPVLENEAKTIIENDENLFLKNDNIVLKNEIEEERKVKKTVISKAVISEAEHKAERINMTEGCIAQKLNIKHNLFVNFSESTTTNDNKEQKQQEIISQSKQSTPVKILLTNANWRLPIPHAILPKPNSIPPLNQPIVKSEEVKNPTWKHSQSIENKTQKKSTKKRSISTSNNAIKDKSLWNIKKQRLAVKNPSIKKELSDKVLASKKPIAKKRRRRTLPTITARKIKPLNNKNEATLSINDPQRTKPPSTALKVTPNKQFLIQVNHNAKAGESSVLPFNNLSYLSPQSNSVNGFSQKLHPHHKQFYVLEKEKQFSSAAIAAVARNPAAASRKIVNSSEDKRQIVKSTTTAATNNTNADCESTNERKMNENKVLFSKNSNKKESEIKWDNNLQLLHKFVTKHGHFHVPQVYNGSRSLYSWLYAQKKRFDNNELSYQQKKKLESIGVRWNERNGTFYNTSSLYKQSNYHPAVNGLCHYSVPVGSIPHPQAPIRPQVFIQPQVSIQSQTHIQPKAPIQPKASIQPKAPIHPQSHIQPRAEAPEPMLIPSASKGHGVMTRGPCIEELSEVKTNRARLALYTWYKRLEELEKYKIEHGNCNVQQKFPKNRELGIWVNKQRQEKVYYDEYYRNFIHNEQMDKKGARKPSLTRKKIMGLDQVGFDWGKRKGQVSWDEKYKELQEYRLTFGDCEVPTKYKENSALGRWVSTQRAQFKKFQQGEMASISKERIEMLEILGFHWHPMKKG